MPQAPRKNNGSNTREAILEAAEALFVESGFAETSMSRIAKRAEVTKSLIHHHFGSKESLWSEVKKLRFKQYSRAQLELFSKRAPDAKALEEGIAQYFDFLRSNPEFVRLTLWSVIDKDRPDKNLADKLSKLGIERIRQAQRQGALREDVDAKSIIIMIFCLTLSWFQSKDAYHAWIGLGQEAGLEDNAYLRDVLKVFFSGALPPGT